jgi:endo-1,4-beta-xylanase
MSAKLLALLTMGLTSGLLAVGTLVSAEEPTLKDAFAADFRIGAAIGTAQIMNDDSAALELVARHFNSITPENLLKWMNIHPQPDRYNFEPADRFVEFGGQHDMWIVGHTLVWHSQTPRWVFQDDDGNPLDRDALIARMQDHIRTVVGRYRGRIHAWDVVNEAIDEDGNLRNSPWNRIIGPDYLEKAFEFAHEADPDAELYYNDYNEWKPAKMRGIIEFVERLQAKGIRIDGVGLQGHWGWDYPTPDELENMFAEYAKLGVKLMITELDMNVLPQPRRGQTGAEISRRFEASRDLNPYPDGLPDEVQQALAERYAYVFRNFLEHRDIIDRVTFWGVHDGHSWLNNWPVRGRTAYPLLFDRQLQPKPAFHAAGRPAQRRRRRARCAANGRADQRDPAVLRGRTAGSASR